MYSFYTSNYDIYWLVAYALLIVVIIVGNLTTIIAARLNRELFNTTSNQLILSLAISDLLVAPAILYDIILDTYPAYNSKYLCILRFTFLCTAFHYSFYNIIAIAVDRYVAIVYPFEHPTYITKSAVLILRVANWFVVLLISTVPLYWNTFEVGCSCEIGTVIPRYYIEAIVVPHFTTVWLSILIIYWKIWKEARAYTRRSKARSREIGLSSNASYSKSNQTVLTILGCFTLCWFPLIGVLFLQVVTLQSDLIRGVFCAAYWIAMCNSGLNPLIYVWKNPLYRNACCCLFGTEARDHNNHNANRLGRLSGLPNKATVALPDGRELQTNTVPKTISVEINNGIV